MLVVKEGRWAAAEECGAEGRLAREQRDWSAHIACGPQQSAAYCPKSCACLSAVVASVPLCVQTYAQADLQHEPQQM